MRRSDKARFLAIVASQVLGLGLIVALLLLPWWASAALIAGAVFGVVLLPDALFPPVVAEQFGSAADTKLAALRFWLAAPIALFILVAAFVAMWRS